MYIVGFGTGGAFCQPCLSPGKRVPGRVYFVAPFGLVRVLALPFFRGLDALAIVPSAMAALSWESRLMNIPSVRLRLSHPSIL